MIARIWHGTTKASEAAAYLRFLEERAIPDYRSVPGNRGVYILHRVEGDRAHFLTLTFWDSRSAIEGFAGKNIDMAKYYPEDKNYLLEFELTVTHYEVSDETMGPARS
jgi:heme-degrading monooxygenase HmoA